MAIKLTTTTTTIESPYATSYWSSVATVQYNITQYKNL